MVERLADLRVANLPVLLVQAVRLLAAVLPMAFAPAAVLALPVRMLAVAIPPVLAQAQERQQVVAMGQAQQQAEHTLAERQEHPMG